MDPARALRRTEVDDDPFASLETVQPGEATGALGHDSRLVQDGEREEPMPHADLKIIHVMGGAHRGDAGSDVPVHE